MNEENRNIGSENEEVTVIKTETKFVPIKEDSANAEKSKRKKKKKKTVEIIPMIICVLVAIMVWYYVMQVDSPDYQDVFKGVEVSLSNTSLLENERNLTVYSGYGYTVDITVSGKKSIISKYSAEDITVTADLAEFTEAGEKDIMLNVQVPSGLSFVQSEYSSIKVYVDEKATVELPVKTKLTGAIYSNEYEYGEVNAEYDRVVAHGPKSEIEKLGSAEVVVDLSSIGLIKESLVVNCKVVAKNKDQTDPNNPYIKLSRSTMDVTIPVYTTKEVPVKVLFEHGYFNDTNSKVTVSPSTVIIKGDPVALSKYSEIIIATIDEKELTSDTVATFELEDYTDFTYEKRPPITVTIKHIGTVVRTYNVSNIKVNTGTNKCFALDRTVNVTLRGTLEQLENITAADISLEVDASQFSDNFSGSPELPATVKIAGGNDTRGVYEVNSYTVQVKVN